MRHPDPTSLDEAACLRASRRIELGTVRGNLGELVRLQDGDAAPLQADPSALCPFAQLLVDALAGAPDDFADLALRDLDLAGWRGRLCGRGEPQQSLRKPRGQREE